MAATPDVLASAAVLLDQATGPLGFVAAVPSGASAFADHYGELWGRDAAVTSLALVATGDAHWHAGIRRSLATLAAHATSAGQIPGLVRSDGWVDAGEHAAVDPTAWWCVAALSALRAGVPGIDELAPAVTDALTWLRGLDVGRTGLVNSPGASDWMDAAVQRTGITLHANALFLWALRLAETRGLPTGPGPDAAHVANSLDIVLWPSETPDPGAALWVDPHPQGGTRLDPRRGGVGWPHPATVAALRAAHDPARRHWASHLRWAHLVDEVDVLGNCLAVLAGLGNVTQRQAVVDGLEAAGVAFPHPSRTLVRPVEAGGADLMLDATADAWQDPRWRNAAWEYHNGGAWPMVGGFHAAAVAAVHGPDAARDLAGDVATACIEDGVATFPEWRDGLTGAAGGARGQTWSAAAVLLADAVVRGKAA